MAAFTVRKGMSVTRRDVLKQTAAGLTFALTLQADPRALVGGAAAADGPLSPNIWVTIATDGTITIVSPAAEMGQGTFTTLPAVLADELDADWAKVKPVYPPEWNEKKYGNPGWDGNFNTTASAGDARLFQADAHRRRAGAARAARCGRGEMERAGRRAFDRAERRRAQGVGPAHQLRRDRGVRQGAGRAAQDRGEGPQAARRASATSARICRASTCRPRSPARRYTASMCRCPAWSMPRCCNRPMRAARRRRSTTPRRARCAGVTDVIRLPAGVARGRQFGRGDAGRQEPPQGHLERCAGRDVAIRSARSRTSPPSRATRVAARRCVHRGRRRQGGDGRGRARVPRRISHALHLSRPDGADERDRHGRSGRQVRGDLGRHAEPDRAAQRRCAPPAAPTAARSRSTSMSSAAAMAGAAGRRTWCSTRCASSRRSASRSR